MSKDLTEFEVWLKLYCACLQGRVGPGDSAGGVSVSFGHNVTGPGGSGGSTPHNTLIYAAMAADAALEELQRRWALDGIWQRRK